VVAAVSKSERAQCAVLFALTCAVASNAASAAPPDQLKRSTRSPGIWLNAEDREPIGTELDPSGPTASPQASKHDGFFMRFGWGATALRSAQLFTSGVEPEKARTLPSRRYTGFGSTASFALGATPFETIVLGGEVSVHAVNQLRLEQGALDPLAGCQECGYGLKHVSVGALALIYPIADLGLNGGLSAGYVALEERTGTEAQTRTYTGIVISPQLGFEEFVSEQWSIGLVVRLTLSSSSTDEDPAGRDTAKIELLSLSGVLTLH